MQLETLIDLMSGIARENKELTCRDGRSDMITLLMGYRGDACAGYAFISKPDRSRINEAARLMAFGFEVDSMAVASEGYAPGIDPDTGEPYTKNPVDGQPWAYSGNQGSMQTVVEEHDGLAKGYVYECIMLMFANRAGDFRLRHLPYVWDEATQRVDWQFREGTHFLPERDDQVLYQGLFFENMTAAMNAPGASVKALQDGIDTNRLELDINTAVALTMLGHVVFVVNEDGKMQEVRVVMPDDPLFSSSAEQS